jgi:site-specific recombinase
MTIKTGLDYTPNPTKRKSTQQPSENETPEAILAMIEESAAKRITVTGRTCDEMAAHLLRTLPDDHTKRLAVVAEARKWIAQADKSESAAERQKLADALAKQDNELARRDAMTGLQ